MTLDEIKLILRNKLATLEAKKMEYMGLGDLTGVEKTSNEYEETFKLLTKLEEVK